MAKADAAAEEETVELTVAEYAALINDTDEPASAFPNGENIRDVQIIHGDPVLITTHGLYTMTPRPNKRGFRLQPVALVWDD